MATKFIVGNWKMNGSASGLDEAEAMAVGARSGLVRVGVCPPATLIERMVRRLAGTGIEVGAQDCHAEPSGAFTGDLSAEMLREAGARLVILGHSERRAGHGETDAQVAAKLGAAMRAGLEPIVCVGESLEERKAGRAAEVVRRQVAASLAADLSGSAFSVAYEPIWAIGSGLTPTPDEIASVHADIRQTLVEMFGANGEAAPILYGGSVKASNAREIFAVPEVGGALVGGASLKAADFLPIVEAG